MNSYVAAIIPVYNEGERILKTLKGLMSVDLIQEIIVVDDGSTDNTSEILRGFSNVRLIKHEKKPWQGYCFEDRPESSLRRG